LLEERNLIESTEDVDEEERYSSVIRAPGKYVPPAARNAAQQAAAKVTQAGIAARKRPESMIATPTTTPPVNTNPVRAPSPQPPMKSVEAAQPEKKEATKLEQPVVVEAKASTNAQQAPAPMKTQDLGVSRGPVSAFVAGSGGDSKDPAASPRKGELLNKLPFKDKPVPGDASAGKDPSQMIGETLQDFRTFAQQERRQIPQKLREMKKIEKSSLINDLKNFSTSFKVKLFGYNLHFI
jgi:hypothetical protein